MSLEGKVALVTGASGMRGIGRAIALKLASMGADIVVTARKDKPQEEFPEGELKAGWKGIESVAQEIRGLGRRAEAIPCDLAYEDQIVNLIDETVKRLGALHIVVNNARSIAGLDQVPLVDLESNLWDKRITIDLRAVFLCCKYGGRQMIKQGAGGRIINIGSLVGLKAAANVGAYSSAKFGVVGLTQAYALEMASHQITVNAVCPGPTDTDRVHYRERAAAVKEGISSEEYHKRWLDKCAKRIPLGRVASSADVAAVAGFLASPEASYLTGLAISVTGGELLH